MAPKPGILELAKRYFRAHAWVYGIAMLLTAVLALTAESWWFFWPQMIWTILFLVHFLVVRSLDIDDDWVAERTARTADKAYDLTHIEDIRDRHEAGSKSGAPGAEDGRAQEKPGTGERAP